MRKAKDALSRFSASRSGTSAIPSKVRTSCTLRFFLGEVDAFLDFPEAGFPVRDGESRSSDSSFSFLTMLGSILTLPERVRLLERVIREEDRGGVALNCSNWFPKEGRLSVMPDIVESSSSSCLTVMACCSCYAKRLLLSLSTDHRPAYRAFRAVEAGISARALASSGRWSDAVVHFCEVCSHARSESQARLGISQKWLRLLYEFAARCNAYMLGITASFDGSHARRPSDSSGCAQLIC